MRSAAFALILVCLLGAIILSLTCGTDMDHGGPFMGLLLVLAMVLAVGLFGDEGRDRSDR